MWCDYFKTLYNSVPDNGESNIFLSTYAVQLTDNDVACVSVREVMDAVSGLKTAKSVGPNGLASGVATEGPWFNSN